MRRLIERFRCKIGPLHKRIAAGALTFCVLGGVFTALSFVDVMTVTDGQGTNYILLAASEAPAEAVRLSGIKTAVNEELVYTATGEGGGTVLVNPAFPVVTNVDGRRVTVEVLDGTVADVLQNVGVVLEGDDFTEPEPTAMLERNMEIMVNRVTYEERTTRVEVLKDDVDAFVATLPEAEQKSFTYSKSRIYDVTYQDRMINGEYADSEIASLTAIYHPYDAPSTAFEPGVPVSSIDGFVGIELDENGIPTTYSRKMSGAVATAYSASRGRGAGGQGLYCGTVAVNPNVIPYGTRLYITSADQKFVYGYAIASDCGTAMMEGRVDVDLYFESNAECRKFGKRALDVYILD